MCILLYLSIISILLREILLFGFFVVHRFLLYVMCDVYHMQVGSPKATVFESRRLNPEGCKSRYFREKAGLRLPGEAARPSNSKLRVRATRF